MVHDDDTQPRDPTEIPWDGEPLDFEPPPNDQISDAILNLARRWDCDRFTLFETLRERYIDLMQAHVNYVLREHRLPHLYR